MSESQEKNQDKEDSTQDDLSLQEEKNKSDNYRSHPGEEEKGSNLHLFSNDTNLRSLENEIGPESENSLFDVKTKSHSDVKVKHVHKQKKESSNSNTEILDGHVGKSMTSVLIHSTSENISFMPDISGGSTDICYQFCDNDEGACRMHGTSPSFIKSSRPESLPLKHSASDNESVESGSFPADPENENAVFGVNAFRKTEAVKTESQHKKKNDDYSSVSQSLPKGTITRKGNLIEFVASDLQEKIKQSSPLSQPDAASSGSRRSSIKSYASASSSTSFATSSGMSQSPSSVCQQSPDDIPPIDASAVIELENHAARVADSLDLMMGNIRNNLHKMSAITIGCQEAYKRSVDITCDSVDGGIKTMYALMAKCEELSASMRPVQQLAVQLKDIKRVLDLFESQL